jgi:hypothetical protein
MILICAEVSRITRYFPLLSVYPAHQFSHRNVFFVSQAQSADMASLFFAPCHLVRLEAHAKPACSLPWSVQERCNHSFSIIGIYPFIAKERRPLFRDYVGVRSRSIRSHESDGMPASNHHHATGPSCPAGIGQAILLHCTDPTQTQSPLHVILCRLRVLFRHVARYRESQFPTRPTHHPCE